ncbi:MAG: 1-acyl-sn-glycerol-3-phosphate acyltransferase [Fimbriimonadaceae bacterium]|nr:1-acyl-sn-glycerol-3-phosphate acyltransferase [Fimbriimonadaceae bacterium]
MNAFRPPKPSPPWIRLAGSVALWVLRARGVQELSIDDESIERLRALGKTPAMLCPNHPTNNEPAVLFELSKRLERPFFYVCCREAFDYFGGLWGWMLQRLGAYSLARGTLDRASFQTTRMLLGRTGIRLVVFPEGEVYSQNDTLLPFQTGVVQLAFWGLEEALKNGLEDVVLVPIAVRYRFLRSQRTAIARSLGRLERALGLETGEGTRYDRLRRIGVEVVDRLTRQFGLEFDDATPLSERMDVLKRTQLEHAARIAGVELRGGSLAEEMRRVLNAVYGVEDPGPPEGASAYDRRLWGEARAHIAPAVHELDRLQNWIAVVDGYVGEDPSDERMAHTLVRLEVEVLGRRLLGGPTVCAVRVGPSISLAASRERYRADRRGAVEEVAASLESAVQAELDALVRLHQAPTP